MRPLQICLVSQSYLPFHGGITEHVWHLGAALAAKGHRVSLLTGEPLRNGRANDPDPPGVRVVRLGRTIRVPSNGARACVTLGWAAGAARLFRSRGAVPDIVHLQSPLEPFLPLWALRHLPGAKVGTFHTAGGQTHWGYRRFAPLLRPFARRLSRRLAVSGSAAGYVARYFPGQYTIVPNGVDLTRFHPSDRPVAPGDPAGLRILYAGRLDPRKGLSTLLDACAALQRCGQAVGLTLVGDGPERPRLEQQARRHGLAVTFAGTVRRAALPRFYQRADLFVAPSLDGESFGVSLLEALASGLPVLAADLPGYRETLSGSGAAHHFTPGSAADLCRKLRRLIPREGLRREMGRAGRGFVRRYAWEQIASRVLELYADALAATDAAERRGG